MIPSFIRVGIPSLFLVGMAAACSASGSVAEEAVAASRAELTGTTVNGVDVSSYNGAVTWTSVKGAGIDFGYARLSTGAMLLDTQFDQNWSAMKAAGLLRGAYQFFRPGQDPTAQADLVIQKVGVLGLGDLPVVLDLETSENQSGATIVANIQAWVARVTAGTGRAPIIYTSKRVWDLNVPSTAFASLPLWVAAWGTAAPSLPVEWTSWTFWQFSDSGSVPGISGNPGVDLDVFNGTLAQLQSLAGMSGGDDDDGHRDRDHNDGGDHHHDEHDRGMQRRPDTGE